MRLASTLRSPASHCSQKVCLKELYCTRGEVSVNTRYLVGVVGVDGVDGMDGVVGVDGMDGVVGMVGLVSLAKVR